MLWGDCDESRVQICYSTKTAEKICKQIWARLTHGNTSKDVVLQARDDGYSWVRPLLLKHELGAELIITWLQDAFGEPLQRVLQEMDVSRDELLLSREERDHIVFKEQQIALANVNEFNGPLCHRFNMKQLVESSAAPLCLAIRKVDGLGDSDDDLLSHPFARKDPDIIDLSLSQSSDGSSVEVISDPPVDDANDLQKLIEILGSDHHDRRNMQLELKKHGDFKQTLKCLLLGGCVDRKIKPEDFVTPEQDPEDKKKMMIQMHGAVIETAQGPLREGHQKAMAITSKVWDAAGEKASGSKKSGSMKTTRNQDFFSNDIHRLYDDKKPQRTPAHMTNKQCLMERAAADDTVESRMAKHHRHPGTSNTGTAGHIMFDIESHELGKDDHVGLTVPQLKQLLRSQKLPVSGKKDKLVKALDDHIVAEGLGADYPDSAFQVRISSEKETAKRSKKRTRRTK